MQRAEVIAADRENCAHPKHGYYNFFLLAWSQVETHELIDNFHIQYICYVLQQEMQRIAEGRPKTHDLIINIPPRSSKSSICSVFLNAWVWTFYPEMQFINVSFSGSLSETHAIKTKNLMESEWYQARWGHVWDFSTKKNTNKKFINTEGGVRFSTSVTGTITGEGGDVITCDDLLDPRQSKSEAERNRANSVFNDTLSSRLNQAEVGLYILVQQRTHQDDVVGRQLRESPEKYKQIIIPATDDYPIEPPSLRRFYQNGLFEPRRFSRKVLMGLESKMSEYAGQYGQKPSKPGGNIFKPDEWFFDFTEQELYERARRFNESLVWNFVVDGAYTANKENCPTVMFCFCYFQNQWFLKDVFRQWLGYTDLIAQMYEFVWKNGYSPESTIWIEPKATGLSMVDSLVTTYGLNAIPGYVPTTDKIEAANSITPTCRARRVGVIKESSWWADFKDELKDFPNSKYKDQVDCTVMMVKNAESNILASG